LVGLETCAQTADRCGSSEVKGGVVLEGVAPIDSTDCKRQALLRLGKDFALRSRNQWRAGQNVGGGALRLRWMQAEVHAQQQRSSCNRMRVNARIEHGEQPRLHLARSRADEVISVTRIKRSRQSNGGV
jgi:hypothetical protein